MRFSNLGFRSWSTVERAGVEGLAIGHGSSDSAGAAVAVVAEACVAAKLCLHVPLVRTRIVERR